jgi:hypothetical protein
MGILRTDKISGLETPTAVTGSVSFDGSGDNLAFTLTGGLGSGDFTLEYFVYQNTLSDYQTHFGVSRGVNGFNVGTDASGDFVLYSASARQIEVIGAITTGRWYHWAFVRSGSTLTGYLDGKAIASYSSSENFSGTSCAIGSLESNAEYTNGYISNFRIIRGTALYTANFTPPTHELEVIGDTVLLCCNNPDSAAAASYAGIGTSKTITVNGDAAASTFSPGLTRDFTFGTQFEGVSRFDTQGYFVPPSGTTEQRGRGRGILYGGYRYNPNANQRIIESIQISSGGNAQKFGDIDVVRYGSVGVASPTRGVFFGGADPSTSDIDFITIATEGNPVEFGSATTNFRNSSGVSNGVRGIVGGKFTPSTVGTIDYVTIAALGDAQDFGDLSETRHSPAAASSNTRGVFAGGQPATDTIDYVTIATVGATAQDFGDLTVSRQALSCSSISNGVRGVFGGGRDPAVSVVIDFVTIATLGNAQDFGDLSVARGTVSGLSDKVRGIFAGGYTTGPTTSVNTIDYVTIASTGNAQDFGDMSIRRALVASCSDSHGGIS